MLADTAPSALLALTAHAPVLADTAASTLLALTALPLVLADVAPAALLTPTALPPMLADATAPALLALIALLPMLADVAPLGPLRGWLHQLFGRGGAIHHSVFSLQGKVVDFRILLPKVISDKTA